MKNESYFHNLHTLKMEIEWAMSSHLWNILFSKNQQFLKCEPGNLLDFLQGTYVTNNQRVQIIKVITIVLIGNHMLILMRKAMKVFT